MVVVDRQYGQAIGHSSHRRIAVSKHTRNQARPWHRGLSPDASIDVSRLAVGDQIKPIGYSGQFAAQYEVLPRGPSDLTEI